MTEAYFVHAGKTLFGKCVNQVSASELELGSHRGGLDLHGQDPSAVTGDLRHLRDPGTHRLRPQLRERVELAVRASGRNTAHLHPCGLMPLEDIVKKAGETFRNGTARRPLFIEKAHRTYPDRSKLSLSTRVHRLLPRIRRHSWVTNGMTM
ncbi:MAG: hypothetical protein AAF488_17750 [Planctomycetota bacterium]